MLTLGVTLWVNVFDFGNSHFVPLLQFARMNIVSVSIQSVADLIRVLFRDFTWLHSDWTIYGIVDVSSEVLEHIYPSRSLILREITFYSGFKGTIEPFYNGTLKFTMNFTSDSLLTFVRPDIVKTFILYLFTKTFLINGFFTVNSFPLSDENITGGWRKVSKIESMALALSSAVLNFSGAVYANREKASIITKMYL